MKIGSYIYIKLVNGNFEDGTLKSLNRHSVTIVNEEGTKEINHIEIEKIEPEEEDPR